MAKGILTVGGITVGRPGKQSGFIPVAPRGDGSAVQLPLLAAAGETDGPTLVVSGGVHGDEFEGPKAIQRFWRQLDPQKMRGVFLGVPVVNVPAFLAGKRRNPADGLDMNRIFPGRETGSISEMIAHCFMAEVVSAADYYVDLHAGGNAFAMAPIVVYLDAGPDDLRADEIALAKAAGLDLLWKGKGLWSAAHVEAVRRGIPAILAEIGQEGRCAEPAVRRGELIIENVMKHAAMIDGQPEHPGEWKVIEGTYATSRAGGCFYPLAGLLERVRKGQAVGLIEDLFGETIETVVAPWDGLIISTRTFPSLGPGEWTTFVGSELTTIRD